MTSEIIQQIKTSWRIHQRWERANNALILQGKALCRSWTGGDKEAATKLFDAFIDGGDVPVALAAALHPFKLALDQFEPPKAKLLKDIVAHARELPTIGWVKGIKNFGDKSFASIIGEAGDLSAYSTHSKLWRRMGMAPFTKDGVTRSGKQWNVKKGLTSEDWTEFGYSSKRRSVMWNIEACLLKGGPYRDVYLARKKYLQEREMARGFIVAPSAKIPAKERDRYVSDGQIHQQSMHYMGKRLLRDLWKAWRRAAETLSETTVRALPSADHSDAASAAVSAINETPKGRGAIADTTNSSAKPVLPRGLRFRVDEVSAKEKMPEGHLRIADTTYSDAAQAAGEADVHLAVTLVQDVSPHISKKAPKGAVSAMNTMPKGRRSIADTKTSVAPQGAAAARVAVPKGQTVIAAAKNTKAPSGAGRATAKMPRKRADATLPSRKSRAAA